MLKANARNERKPVAKRAFVVAVRSGQTASASDQVGYLLTLRRQRNR